MIHSFGLRKVKIFANKAKKCGKGILRKSLLHQTPLNDLEHIILY